MDNKESKRRRLKKMKEDKQEEPKAKAEQKEGLRDLVDTSEEEANKRILERKDHFYKGDARDEDTKEEVPPASDDEEVAEDSDWEFAPVTFPHTILNGDESVETNAKKVLEVLKELMAAE